MSLLEDSDVIMLFRVQHESHDVVKVFSKESYHRRIWINIRTRKKNEKRCDYYASSSS